VFGAVEPPSASPGLVFLGEKGAVGATYYLGSSCLPEARHVVTNDGFLVADSRDGILYSFDRSGDKRILHQATQRATVSAGAVEAVERFIRGSERMSGRATRRSKESVRGQIGQVGDPLPSVWSAMVQDVSGRVWLRRASCFSADSIETWEVFDDRGKLLATVRVPQTIRILSVNRDRLIGVVTDHLDVGHVAVFRIRR
jgi:hypothetical protein